MTSGTLQDGLIQLHLLRPATASGRALRSQPRLTERRGVVGFGSRSSMCSAGESWRIGGRVARGGELGHRVSREVAASDGSLVVLTAGTASIRRIAAASLGKIPTTFEGR